MQMETRDGNFETYFLDVNKNIRNSILDMFHKPMFFLNFIMTFLLLPIPG